jgi:peptidoglycan/xylan/chitin deacetylase (PgdA/CDA1 family)
MFAVPARVLEQERSFFQELAGRGVELCLHGYDHVDFRALTREQAERQFRLGHQAYVEAGVPVTGFRCPYLSFDDTVARAVPGTLFVYSSNVAVRWPVDTPPPTSHAAARQLAGFYRASSANDRVSIPRRRGSLIEVPASLPDDFELVIAAGAPPEVITRVWLDVWEQVRRRGELFAPLFHPEAFSSLAPAFEALLRDGRSRGDDVWIARTTDIAHWWVERGRVEVSAEPSGGRFRLRVRGHQDATLLVSGLTDGPGLLPWDGRYRAVAGSELVLHSDVLPFIAVSPSFPQVDVAYLQEEGFVVVRDGDPRRFAFFLDAEASSSEPGLLARLEEEVEYPLARLWRWPRRAKSVLSFAGDLDALRLSDYLQRFRGL